MHTLVIDEFLVEHIHVSAATHKQFLRYLLARHTRFSSQVCPPHGSSVNSFCSKVTNGGFLVVCPFLVLALLQELVHYLQLSTSDVRDRDKVRPVYDMVPISLFFSFLLVAPSYLLWASSWSESRNE